MGSYNPKITISSAPGVLDNLVVALAEATNPSVFVAFQVLNPPHSASVQLVFAGLNPVMHNVTIFETSGTTPAGTVRANFALDPKFPTVNLKLPVFAHAGSYPGFSVGGNSITNSDWIGWEGSLEIRGIGPMEPSAEFTWDDTTGTVDCVIPGYAAGDQELWIISFDPQIITVASSSTSSPLFSNISLITGDQTLSNSDAGKAFIILSNIAGNKAPTIQLPLLSTMPDNQPIYIMSGDGNHFNAILKCQGSDKIQYYGSNSQVVLGRSESMWLFCFTNGPEKLYYAINADTGIQKVGEIVNNYRTNEINTVFANGQLLRRDTFVRLWNEIQNLDPSQLITDTLWNTGSTSKGFYSTGDGSTTFRVPLLYTPGFLRAVDGASRKAGQRQLDAIMQHRHDTLTGAIAGSPNGTGPSKSVVGGYNGTHSGVSDLSSHMVDDTGAILTKFDNNETRPDNTGIYLLIRI